MTSAPVVTGAGGFLGWHTRCHYYAANGTAPTPVGRAELADPATLAAALGDSDTVLHLAGVNRADDPHEVEQGNVWLATTLADALRRRDLPTTVVFASSIQVGNGSAYAVGKARAAEILGEAVTDVGGRLADLRLPNLFGEHGRPHYNSFVSTFCHALATGGRPTVQEDRTVPLLHAQRAAAALWSAATDPRASLPDPTPRTVSDVLSELERLHELYRAGEVPDRPDEFSRDLFNTLRSFYPVDQGFSPTLNTDPRGGLFETVRSHGGPGQAFVSTTLPGQSRGHHYHLRKFERFAVVTGEAEISLRRLLHDDVVRVRVSGREPRILDMPTMWTHALTNVGDSDLVTMFWADELLDRAAPDQYPEAV